MTARGWAWEETPTIATPTTKTPEVKEQKPEPGPEPGTSVLEKLPPEILGKAHPYQVWPPRL